MLAVTVAWHVESSVLAREGDERIFVAIFGPDGTTLDFYEQH